MCKAPELLPRQMVFCKPVTQSSFGPCSDISSFLACTTVRGFQQVRQQNFGIVGKTMCKLCSSLWSRKKLVLSQKEVILHQCNHLKESSKEEKTSGYRGCYESNQRFIISSAALIRMTAVYCHGFVLVSRCMILTTSWELDQKQHPAALIVTRQHYLVTMQKSSARPGRSHMNAHDFVLTREIDAVCVAMIDLKDSF